MTLLIVWRDVLRLWSRRPGVPCLAVISIAVGIAASTSVFAVADAALWRPLPVAGPERLVWVNTRDRDLEGAASPGVFAAWQSDAESLEGIGALRAVQGIVRDVAGTDRIAGALATSSVFSVIGGGAEYGRVLEPHDDTPGAPPVVVLTHRFWRTRYGADPAMLGRGIEIDGRLHSIVGVMPASFDEIPFGADWWAPLALAPAATRNVQTRYLDVIARIRDGDASSASAELTAIARAVGATGDTGLPLSVRMKPLQEHFGDEAGAFLVPLLGGVLIVVLLSAINAAGLMLAQGQERAGEIAIRASLGATRGRIARQLAAESALLAAVAGALSLVLAQWGTAGLVQLFPREFPRLDSAAVDVRAVLFTAALVSAVLGVMSLVPAIRGSRVSLIDGLAGGARGTVSGPDRLRRGFVVAQVALAMSLAMAGALMLQSTWALAQAPRGYDGDRVLTASVRFSRTDYPTGVDLLRASERIVSAATQIPGLPLAALATRVPLSGGAPGSDLTLVAEPFASGVDRQVRIRFVTPGFFKAVGTPILEGRDLSPSDHRSNAPVVVVNETLARRLSPTRSIVGQAVKFAVADFNPGGQVTEWRVVGRVADSFDRGPRESVEPEVYVNMAQGPAGLFDWIGREALLVIKAQQGHDVTPEVLRAAVQAAEPRIPLFDVLTLDDRFNRHLWMERLLVGLLVPLGGAGIGLAAFGVFALITQQVTSRRRELALRMALGASSSRVLTATMLDGLALAALGVAIGLAGAAAASRVLEAVSFGVESMQPVLLALVASAILLSSVLAVWLPAWRAARLDPVIALRDV